MLPDLVAHPRPDAGRARSQGIDEYQEEPVEKGAFYLQDPTGRRTGNACDPKVSKVRHVMPLHVWLADILLTQCLAPTANQG